MGIKPILYEKNIIPLPAKNLPIKDKLKLLEVSLELYAGAVDKCNAAEISDRATKIGVYSFALREELNGSKDETALKSLVDLNIIEQKFRGQQNRLMEGHCKCKTKGIFF